MTRISPFPVAGQPDPLPHRLCAPVSKSARWERGGVISSSPRAKLYSAEWPSRQQAMERLLKGNLAFDELFKVLAQQAPCFYIWHIE